MSKLQTPMEDSLMDRCPDCNSDNIIPWDDGYLCCECGTEFDEPESPEY